MMAGQQRNGITRSYLAKDYSALRGDLLEHARTFYSDRIQDFSEASVGGLFLDMAASVGDTLSFYLDHQFRETSWSDAVETANIEKHIRNAGVKIGVASPANVTLTFLIEVRAVLDNGAYVPDYTLAPKIQALTEVQSKSGVTFITVEDLDMAEMDSFGNRKATVNAGTTSNGVPTSFILSRDVMATSGLIANETFTIPDNFVPYRTITLTNSNVSEILSVTDSDGNDYYEVDSLTQDTAYKPVKNFGSDSDAVPKVFTPIAAPRRFMTTTAILNRKTSMMFGGGDETAASEDAIPDPSKFAIPMYGNTTVTRFSIDPRALLKSKTMGIAPRNTSITVNYRYGGGNDHNVIANDIRKIKTLRTVFPSSASPTSAASVRASTEVINSAPATGGASAPTVDDMRALIPAARNSQQRIVSKDDLLARVFSIPTMFGRVEKAGIRPNPVNPLSIVLHVASINSDNLLIQSSDTLKKNLSNYLNEFRLISDAIDILDCSVVDYTVGVKIVVVPNTNPIDVSSQVRTNISNVLNTKKFTVDQPIILSDITLAVINTPGVLSLMDTTFSTRRVSPLSVEFDFALNMSRGIVIPPPGGVFELVNPNTDIIVTVV
jgi:hypothetical protein